MRKTLLFLFLFLIFPTVHAETSQVLKVLTLNTWMIPGQRQMAAARAQAIGRQIKKYDFVALQETFTAGMRKTIATTAERSGRKFYNRYQTRPVAKLNSGKFSLSKYEITKSGFKKFQNCSGIQCLAGKGVLYTQIRLPNGRLVDIFNTHLQANEKDMMIRRWQLLELRAYIDRINKGRRPVVFTGDFNIIAEVSEYDELMNVLHDFKDVWKVANPENPGHTWNPEKNHWAKTFYDETFIKQRLDYIFVRDGEEAKWNIAEANIVFDRKVPWVDPQGATHEILVSDHFGVEATLELPASSTR